MAAEASFKTDIFSISLGSIAFNSPNEAYIPSISIIGLPPFTEISPRICMDAPSLPGRVEERVIVKPGTAPCKAKVALFAVRFFKVSSPRIWLIALVKEAFFCVP